MKRLVGIIIFLIIINSGVFISACVDCANYYGIDNYFNAGYLDGVDYGYYRVFKYVNSIDNESYMLIAYNSSIVLVDGPDGFLTMGKVMPGSGYIEFWKPYELPSWYFSYWDKLNDKVETWGGYSGHSSARYCPINVSFVKPVEGSIVEIPGYCFDGSGPPVIHEYIDYVIDVREIQRGKDRLPFVPEIYYYMAMIQPHLADSTYMDDPVKGTLYLIDDSDDFFVGEPPWKSSYTYKKEFRVVGPKDDYRINNGDFGIMGGKFYSLPPKRDKLRFAFWPDSEEYRILYFTIDFTLMDEELRNGFTVGSDDEKYQLPDDMSIEDLDQDYIDSINNIVGPGEYYNPGDGSIWYVVQEFLVNQFNEIFSKFSDITDIFVALKNVIKGSLVNDDWDGIKINFAGAGTFLNGEYMIVNPGPINKVRVQLRVIMSGCIYLVTAIFVVRKAKDIF